MFSLRQKPLKTLYPALQCMRLSYSSSPKCFMMGDSGIIDIEEDMFVDLQQYLKFNPMLHPIPVDKVIGAFDSARPYLLLDTARRLLYSGALTAYFTHKSGHRIQNPFVRGNVGVHKNLGLLVFKSITETDSEMPQPLYHCYADFLLSIIASGNISSSQLPMDLAVFLDDLKDRLVDEDSILEHPTLFSENLYADVCVEVYRILCKQASVHDVPPSLVDAIFLRIGAVNTDAIRKCLGHGLFPQFMPKLPPQGQNSTYSSQQLGDFIVSLHRHGAIHSVEHQVNLRVKHYFKNFTPPLKREDVLRAYRVQFSLYLRDVFRAFKKASYRGMPVATIGAIYKDLRIADRFPVPDVYRAKPISTIFDKVSHIFIIVNSY